MIILVGSKIDESSIQSSLGKPEYSYYFLMKDFLPLLERLGRVVIVNSINEIESLTASYTEVGEQVVFFSFSPPHQVPLGLPCATIVVFAWEFDSLPNIPWEDNLQNDWRFTLGQVKGAISTSREAAKLVTQAMPAGYPVLACPAPIWNRFSCLMVSPPRVELGARTFPFRGIVIDSALLGLSADGLVRKPDSHPMPEPVEPEPQPIALEPKDTPPVLPSRSHKAWLTSCALARGWWQEVSPSRKPKAIVPIPVPVEVAPAQPEPAPLPNAYPVSVSGIVYTAVLSPADSRKNWVEIVTAFCWALKDVADATLVLKMTHHDLEYYRIVLITLLSRLAPFKCRVLVLHGFLEDDQYQELVKASTFYVNASSGEGLCLPLMEYLSAGKPAIAPSHTAMADYMDEQLGFVIRCSPEPFCWPHDPARLFTTHRHRLNWESLMDAFRRGYQVARHEPDEYQRLAANAFDRMRDFASVEVLEQPLRKFLTKTMPAYPGATEPADAGRHP